MSGKKTITDNFVRLSDSYRSNFQTIFQTVLFPKYHKLKLSWVCLSELILNQ